MTFRVMSLCLAASMAVACSSGSTELDPAENPDALDGADVDAEVTGGNLDAISGGPDVTIPDPSPDTAEPNPEPDVALPTDGDTVSTDVTADSGVSGDISSGSDAMDAGGDADAMTSEDAAIVSAGPCGLPQHAVSGALCGPADSPCVLLTEEVIPSDPVNMSDSLRPALALGPDGAPRVLFAHHDTKDPIYAERDVAGGWTTETWELEAKRLTLGVDPQGTNWAVIRSGGQAGNYLYTSGATGVWQDLGAIHTTEVWPFATRVPDILVDSDGCIHAAVVMVGGGETIAYGLYDGAWAFDELTTEYGGSGQQQVRLGHDGTPHLLYLASMLTLQWTTVGHFTEVLDESPPYSSGYTVPMGMTVTPPDDANPTGRPHVLRVRMPVATEYALGYSTREAGGAWTFTELDTFDEPDFNVMCSQPAGPSGSEPPCDVAWTIYTPLEVLSNAAGDVRLLYARTDYTAALAWTCAMDGSCFWETVGSADVVVEWIVGWPEGDAVQTVSLGTGFPLGRPEVLLSPDGVIHMTVAVGTEDAADGQVHYLTIGGQP